MVQKNQQVDRAKEFKTIIGEEATPEKFVSSLSYFDDLEFRIVMNLVYASEAKTAKQISKEVNVVILHNWFKYRKGSIPESVRSKFIRLLKEFLNKGDKKDKTHVDVNIKEFDKHTPYYIGNLYQIPDREWHKYLKKIKPLVKSHIKLYSHPTIMERLELLLQLQVLIKRIVNKRVLWLINPKFKELWLKARGQLEKKKDEDKTDVDMEMEDILRGSLFRI